MESAIAVSMAQRQAGDLSGASEMPDQPACLVFTVNPSGDPKELVEHIQKAIDEFLFGGDVEGQPRLSGWRSARARSLSLSKAHSPHGLANECRFVFHNKPLSQHNRGELDALHAHALDMVGKQSQVIANRINGASNVPREHQKAYSDETAGAIRRLGTMHDDANLIKLHAWRATER